MQLVLSSEFSFKFRFVVCMLRFFLFPGGEGQQTHRNLPDFSICFCHCLDDVWRHAANMYCVLSLTKAEVEDIWAQEQERVPANAASLQLMASFCLSTLVVNKLYICIVKFCCHTGDQAWALAGDHPGRGKSAPSSGCGLPARDPARSACRERAGRTAVAWPILSWQHLTCLLTL